MRDVFDPGGTTIARLAEVAAGQEYPLWADFYRQARSPLEVTTANQMKFEARIYSGTLFLLLDDSSQVKMGDYLLVGMRLTRPCRPDLSGLSKDPPQPVVTPQLLDPYVELKACSEKYRPKAPWILAEVVQAVEVQGNLVRLRSAVSQDYFVISVRDPILSNDWIQATEVIAVPAVASVFYGDSFDKTVTLSSPGTFPVGSEQQDPSFGTVPITGSGITTATLQRELGVSPGPVGDPVAWGKLFVAISGNTQPATGLTWNPTVKVDGKGLLPTQLSALLDAHGQTLSASPFVAVAADGTNLVVNLDPKEAKDAKSKATALVMEVDPTKGPSWAASNNPSPGPGQFHATHLQYTFKPLISPTLNPGMLGAGGLLVVTGQANETKLSSFKTLTTTLELTSSAFTLPADPITVTAASGTQIDTSNAAVYSWTADWSIPAPAEVTTAGWYTTPGDGAVVLEPTSGNVTSYTWKKLPPAAIGISSIPVGPSDLDPLAGMKALWLLGPSTANVLPTDLWEIWSFVPPSPWSLQFSGRVALQWSSPAKSLLADAVAASGALTITLTTGDERTQFPGPAPTQVSALLSSPASSYTATRAWLLTDAGGLTPDVGDPTKDPMGPRPAVALATSAAVIASETDWWWNGVALCREIKKPYPNKPAGSVAKLVEYYAQGIDITPNAFNSGTGRLQIDVPHGWSWNDDSGDPNPDPPAAFIVIQKTSSYEIYTLVGPLTIPQPGASITVNLVGSGISPSGWKKVYFVRRDLFDATKRGTITERDSVDVPSMPAWITGAPASDTSVGLQLVKSGLPGACVPMRMFKDPTANGLLFVFRTPLTPLPSFDQIYLSIQTWPGGALTDECAAVLIQRYLPTGIPSSAIKALVFGSVLQPPWAPVNASSTTDPAVIDLDKTLAQILGPGSPSARLVSFVLARIDASSILPADVQGRGLTLTARTGTAPKWLTIPKPDALVLHDGAMGQACVTAPSAPSALGQRGWSLAFPGLAVQDVFDAQAKLEVPFLAAAQQWSGSEGQAFTFSGAGLQVTLGLTSGGNAISLAIGDELDLLIGSDLPLTATIKDYDSAKRLCTLEQDPSTDPDTVRLHSVKTAAAQPGGFAVDADFSPPLPPEQAPWLLTFEPAGPIAANLLLYSSALGQTPLTFTESAVVDAIYDQLAGTPLPLLLYTNQRGNLYQLFYQGPSDPQNFLAKDAAPTIRQLIVNKGNVAGAGNANVLLCSSAQLPAKSDLQHLGAPTGKGGLGSGNQVDIVSQSIVFNSGNFIPLLGTGVPSDARVIVNAIRVYRLYDDPNASMTLMTYDPDLSGIVQDIEAGNAEYDPHTHQLNIKDTDPPEAVPLPKQSYSFQKTADGTFTLNFLICDEVLPASITVRLIVQYFAPVVSDGDKDPKDRLYQFETPIVPWSRSKQLIVLDSGSLKPGDILFLRDAAQSPAPPIQWTRIKLVNGPVLTVDPELAFETTPVEIQGLHDFLTPFKAVVEDTLAGEEAVSFLRYTLSGVADPGTKLSLDAAYYAAMKGAALAPDPRGSPDKQLLPLGNSLVLDPRREGDRALLDELIPGDGLLLWDDPAREAWRCQRRSGQGAALWKEWPDLQFETQVKEVNPATGLLVLADLVPARFAIPCKASGAGPIAPDPDAVSALRVLPHYRAPFQGRRERVPVGSGDKGHRFARFAGTLDPATGLATLPLDPLGVFASNVEVLVLDPRSDAWSRWTQFADLTTAKAENLAYQLGVDADHPSAGGGVPFSISFGDGKTGQLLPTGTSNVFVRSTQISRWARKLPAPRRLRVFEVQAPPIAPLPWLGPVQPVLRCLVEFSAPVDNRPTDGKDAWRSSLGIETIGGGELLVWGEDVKVPCPPGQGYIFVNGVRSGVVEVFFFRQTPVVAAEIRAWELPDTRLWRLDEDFYPAMEQSDLSSGAGATRLQLLETEGLAPGALLALFPDATSPPEIATIRAVDPATYSAELEKPLVRTYPLASSSLQGNLVEVVQGSSDLLVLGSGDGSTMGLRLPVQTTFPLLFVASDDGPPEPGISVLVDDVPWTRVLDFAGSGPRDRVYRIDIDPDGSVFVTFGDGQQGAVPAPGIDNITALIRTGEGGSGNLPAGGISALRSGSLAVKSTSNLLGSTGGYAGDGADDARSALLGPRGDEARVVTAGDLVRAACLLGEVIHARLDDAPFGELQLVVTLADRSTPTPLVLETLSDRLQGLLPAAAGVTLYLSGAAQISVHLIVKFAVLSGYRQADVIAALGAAFSAGPGGFFGADRWPIAELLRLGDVYEAIFAVKGVASANVVWMHTQKRTDDQASIVAEAIDPGPRGVIRCDDDPAGDPRGERGTLTFSPGSGASP